MPYNYLKLKNKPKQAKQMVYQFTPSDLEEIEQMARSGMSKYQIATNFIQEVSRKTFLYLIELPDHSVHQAYIKGEVQGEFIRQSKMNENAEKGNITATQQLEKKTEANRLQDLKNQFWG